MSAQQAIDGVIISLTDIHVLKQLVAESEHARSEAERANCAKDDFLATLSHELRTPLSSMLLNAQRLRGGEVADQAEMRRTGELLERSTWMQVKLIDDLLDVSRIVADKLTLDCSAIDLRATVRAVLDGMSSLIAAKSLEVCTAFDPELAPIWADGSRVQQVASNLLTNAIKFTPRGGKIRVTVSSVEGMARLRVTDTGIGIDSDFLPHVFTRFSQRDRSITRKYGGLGLGLALVRHLVELQGGTARVKSEGPGHGATFTVTFPFASMGGQTQITAAPAVEVAHALDRPGRTQKYDQLIGLRVLVVDDDLRTREAVREVLELAGTRVEVAGSVAEGLETVTAFEPQVILCDIAMPGEDGYAFMRKLRAQRAGRAAPIPALALTALAAADDRNRALDAGFALHLAKPVDIDRLREAVLELSRMTRPASAPLLQPE
jgi:two-component system CheB/CheR fusion protein